MSKLVEFKFEPVFWRDNYKVEADLLKNTQPGLISKILYRRPYVIAVVTDDFYFKLLGFKPKLCR